MNWGFNSAANDERTSAVSLDALRGQALKRLSGVQQRLDGQGVSAVFTRSAKADAVGDMGFLSGLILDMIVLGSFSAFLGSHITVHHHAAGSAFNHAAGAVGAEGISMMCDQEADGYRRRKGGDYPEGRRRCALEAARLSKKKFNLVSGQQTNRFSFDAKAELACLYEILDVLDRLEDEGVRMMRLDSKQPVYDVLKQMSKKMFGKGAVRSYSTPVMRVV
jgi:hypothetical protein